jgi:hypothetical protein
MQPVLVMGNHQIINDIEFISNKIEKKQKK